MSAKDLPTLQSFLKESLEEGTFFLKPKEVFEAIQEVLPQRGGKEGPELDNLVLELLAGLASYYPGDYEAAFLKEIRNETFPFEARLKALQSVRSHLFDPDKAPVVIRLYQDFMNSKDARFKDFATRSFLQTLTEMHLGGQAEFLLAREGTKTTLSVILRQLAQADWLEASELLDFLQL